MRIKQRLKASLICGAIGDSLGARFENSSSNQHPELNFRWSITDDTQLTLATCEALPSFQKKLRNIS